MTLRTLRLLDLVTLQPVTVTNTGGHNFLSYCDVPKNATSDLSGFNCRLCIKNKSCRVDEHFARDPSPCLSKATSQPTGFLSLHGFAAYRVSQGIIGILVA